VTAGLTDQEIDAIGPLPRAHGLLGAVLAESAPLRVPDIRSDRRARRWWPRTHPAMGPLLGVPLVAETALVGALYVANDAGGRAFDEADEAALRALAERAAPLARTLRRADDTGVLMLASERARIARDLHDALSQSLFSIGLRADAARLELASEPGRAAAHIESIGELARTAREELSAAVEGLRAPAVDDEGLARALERLVALLDRLGDGRVRAEVRAEPALSPERARQAYLVLQEALVNAVRHARAAEVRLELTPDGAGVRAEVSDDGVGFRPDDARMRARRLGLNSMRERAGAIGATLEVESALGEGTRVVLVIPDG